MSNCASSLDGTPVRSLWHVTPGAKTPDVSSHMVRTLGSTRTNLRRPLLLLPARCRPATQTWRSRICDESERIGCLGSTIALSDRHGASPQHLGDLRYPPAGGSRDVCNCHRGCART